MSKVQARYIELSLDSVNLGARWEGLPFLLPNFNDLYRWENQWEMGAKGFHEVYVELRMRKTPSPTEHT